MVVFININLNMIKFIKNIENYNRRIKIQQFKYKNYGNRTNKKMSKIFK
jgi:hypothetical protein